MPSWTVFVKALLNTMRKRPCWICANEHLQPDIILSGDKDQLSLATARGFRSVCFSPLRNRNSHVSFEHGIRRFSPDRA